MKVMLEHSDLVELFDETLLDIFRLVGGADPAKALIEEIKREQEPKPTEAQPTEAQPTEAQPTEAQPTEAQPVPAPPLIPPPPPIPPQPMMQQLPLPVPLAPPAPPARPAETKQSGTPDPETLDVEGIPWDERIHSATPTLTKEGKWRRRKGIPQLRYDEIISQLKQPAAPMPPAPTPKQTSIMGEVTLDSILIAAGERGIPYDRLGEYAKPFGYDSVISAAGDPAALQSIFEAICDVG